MASNKNVKRRLFQAIPAFCLLLCCMAGCQSTKQAQGNERLVLIANENPGGFDFSKLADQTSLLAGQPRSRGIVEGAIISLASNGIK